MNRPSLIRLGILSRNIALVTSVVGAFVFGAYFATETYIPYGIRQYFLGNHPNPSLIGFLILFTAIFAGYLAASSEKLAEIGGTVVVVSVATMFVWCLNTIGLLLSPVALALAGPAILHLASVVLLRAADRKAYAEQIDTHPERETPTPQAQPDPTYREQELVVGAA